MPVPFGKKAMKVTEQISEIRKHPQFVESKKSRGWAKPDDSDDFDLSELQDLLSRSESPVKMEPMIKKQTSSQLNESSGSAYQRYI